MKKSWRRFFIDCLKCSPSTPKEVVAVDGEDNNVQVVEKRKPGGWKCMPYIIGNETFERVASSGLTANFTVYLVSRYHMKQVAAANFVNVYSGVANSAPLLGAFISDAYWGRFRTLAYASVASLLGMVVMTLTAAIPQLRQQSCSPAAEQAGQCEGPTRSQLGVLILSLALMSVGSGGIRPCNLPFGVDQFDKTTESGRRGLASFFNWYYCTSTAAIILAMTLIVYIQSSISWPVGFGIPAGLMVISITLFFLGMRLYVYVPVEGSVFSGIAQVFVAAYKKRKLELPAKDDVVGQERMLYDPPTVSHGVMKLPLTPQFSFLNKAAVICEGDTKEDGTPANSWRLCSVQQIEEAKCLIRILPIWPAGLSCFVALAQQWTFVILQCLKMDRHLGPRFQIPSASVPIVALLALTLFIPIYDQLFVPLARRFTGIESGITLLQRQGAGIVMAALSMVVAGVVERKRRDSAVAHGGLYGSSPLSAAWLVPQLVLMGVAEAFNAIGQVEFYNRQFPEHMQTIAAAFFTCSLAGASYLSAILVSAVRKYTSWLEDDNNMNADRLDYFYYLIAVLEVVNTLYFLVAAHFYRYKGAATEVELKEVREARAATQAQGTTTGEGIC
ncbi:protein NRT1/ PTR FAMILY 2.13 [Elaeis guineensis]|uniref:Protein NRT1/ PTR FAMILY 2.13 n=1 Tax=Elaeis guineensis var. tenera TaxID=51953 RepID=A0A6J0PAS3_ELAGV|nr:protein NRT1/ PTR FAMILY 2.13 [Elaeis guineensis]